MQRYLGEIRSGSNDAGTIVRNDFHIPVDWQPESVPVAEGVFAKIFIFRLYQRLVRWNGGGSMHLASVRFRFNRARSYCVDFDVQYWIFSHSGDGKLATNTEKSQQDSIYKSICPDDVDRVGVGIFLQQLHCSRATSVVLHVDGVLLVSF